MRSTLFYIPHELGPLPIFGLGWALLALCVAWLISRFIGRDDGRIDWAAGWMSWVLAAMILIFAAPAMESKLQFEDGLVTIGMPIRGYGVMLLLGVLTGSYWTYLRGKRFGLTIDPLYSLAFWGMVGGIGGARLFYVIQKWSEFEATTIAGKLFEALRFTEGGLVVYGGVIGGLIATGLWCYLRGFSYFMLADIVTPAFLIGLALGRIGCLFNGCCFGGVCYADVNIPVITFPQGSPPYGDQLENGTLLGADLIRNPESSTYRVSQVKPGSWAAETGLTEDDIIRLETFTDVKHPASPPKMVLKSVSAKLHVEAPLPERSLPVHPTQIYASVNAAILCALLATIPLCYSWRGFIFSLGLIMYGMSRIIEEFIRVDEVGQFGTNFSIGQWVSFFGILAGATILAGVIMGQRKLDAAGPLRRPPTIHT